MGAKWLDCVSCTCDREGGTCRILSYGTKARTPQWKSCGSWVHTEVLVGGGAEIQSEHIRYYLLVLACVQEACLGID